MSYAYQEEFSVRPSSATKPASQPTTTRSVRPRTFDPTRITGGGDGDGTLVFASPSTDPLNEAARLYLAGDARGTAASARQQSTKLANAAKFSDSAVDYVSSTCMDRLSKTTDMFRETVEAVTEAESALAAAAAEAAAAEAAATTRGAGSPAVLHARLVEIDEQLVFLRKVYNLVRAPDAVADALRANDPYTAATLLSTSDSMLSTLAELSSLRRIATRLSDLSRRTADAAVRALARALDPLESEPIDAQASLSYARLTMDAIRVFESSPVTLASLYTVAEVVARAQATAGLSRVPAKDTAILSLAAGARLGFVALDQISQDLGAMVWAEAADIAAAAASAAAPRAAPRVGAGTETEVPHILEQSYPPVQRLQALTSVLMEWGNRCSYAATLCGKVRGCFSEAPVTTQSSFENNRNVFDAGAVWRAVESQFELAAIACAALPPPPPMQRFNGWFSTLARYGLNPPDLTNVELCTHHRAEGLTGGTTTVHGLLDALDKAVNNSLNSANTGNNKMAQITSTIQSLGASVKDTITAQQTQTNNSNQQQQQQTKVSFCAGGGATRVQLLEPPTTGARPAAGSVTNTGTVVGRLRTIFGTGAVPADNLRATVLLHVAVAGLQAIEACPNLPRVIQMSMRNFCVSLLALDAVDALHSIVTSLALTQTVFVPTPGAAQPLEAAVGAARGELVMASPKALPLMLLLHDLRLLTAELPERHRPLLRPLVVFVIGTAATALRAELDFPSVPSSLACDISYADTVRNYPLHGDVSVLYPLATYATPKRGTPVTALDIAAGPTALLRDGIAGDIAVLETRTPPSIARASERVQAALAAAAAVRASSHYMFQRETVEVLSATDAAPAGRLLAGSGHMTLSVRQAATVAACRTACLFTARLAAAVVLGTGAGSGEAEAAVQDLLTTARTALTIIVANARVTFLLASHHAATNISAASITPSVEEVYSGAVVDDEMGLAPLGPAAKGHDVRVTGAYLRSVVAVVLEHTPAVQSEVVRRAVVGGLAVAVADSVYSFPSHIDRITPTTVARIIEFATTAQMEIAQLLPSGTGSSLMKTVLVDAPLGAAIAYISLLGLSSGEVAAEARRGGLAVLTCSRKALQSLLRRLPETPQRALDACCVTYEERLISLVRE